MNVWMLGAAGLAAFLFAKRSEAALTDPNASYSDANYYGDEWSDPNASYSDANYYGDNDYHGDFWDQPLIDVSTMDFLDIFAPGAYMSTPESNLSAFLYMIRSTEHVYPRDVVNDACYQIFYGGSYFENLIDHPVITGEKVGVPLPAAMCRAAGYASGKCVSTAAGAYQIIKPTWNSIRENHPRLPDFSKASQDEAARRLLEKCGALALIYSGDIQGAIRKASSLWASLPGSSAQQNPKSMTFALSRYNEGIANGVA